MHSGAANAVWCLANTMKYDVSKQQPPMMYENKTVDVSCQISAYNPKWQNRPSGKLGSKRISTSLTQRLRNSMLQTFEKCAAVF
jgi:hypothetical protein